MTRLPFERRNLVKVVDGPDYQIPHFCANPLCDETQIERHHIVRRSELGGDHAWVEYDGLKIQNLCGLCREHHQQITENKAAIQWQEHMRRYVWVQNGGWESGGSVVALSPGPISIDATPDIVRGETPPFAPEHSEHTTEAETNSNVCPSCKRPFRHKAEDDKQEPKKIRKTWALAVPKEEQEDGAEVLDSLLEEARKIMAAGGMVAYSDEKKARYYVLSAALSLFVLHAQEVMADA